MSNVLSKQGTNYWRELIGDGPTQLNLPFDYPKNSIPHFESYGATISNKLAKSIKNLSEQEEVHSSIILTTIFTILLYRYSNEEGIYLGALMKKNEQQDPKVNDAALLLIKSKLKPNMTFKSALDLVNRNSKTGIPYLESFHEVLMKWEASAGRTFFQVMVDIQETNINEIKRTSDLLDECNSIFSAQVDLMLKIKKTVNGYKLSFVYNENIFKKESIKRMAGHFNKLMEEALLDPDIFISRIPMLTDEERHQLLVEWNQPNGVYRRETSIHQLFEEQVKSNPDNVAVIFKNERLTYKQLNDRANQIANFLIEQGILKEQLVAICLERCPDMIASFLGVLKSGGAYIPFDLAYPNERIQYMMEDANASFVITSRDIWRGLPEINSKVVFVEDIREYTEFKSQIDSTCPESLAYIMYTSGSTGKPKGVEISHRGVVRLVKNNQYANFGPEETFLNRGSVAFDVSVFEIYGALLNGGKLVVMNTHKPTFYEIATTVKQFGVTTLRVGPDLLNILLEDYSSFLEELKQVFSGGDVLPVWLAQKFKDKLPNTQLINAYGPTENTVNTTCHYVMDESFKANSIPIGKPISNDQVYILDNFLQPVPIGVIGELYISGDGISRGYFNRKEQTEKSFLPNPFNETISKTMYKSGDLVRYLADGNIEFIGRKDDQVKIRGNRIELGEVENILGSNEGIRNLVASIKKGVNGTNELAVYVVMKKDEYFDSQKLRDYAKSKLPEFMMPTFFVELDEIPVTPVGKIDRKRLPDPILSLSKNEYVQPRNEVEEKLANIWKMVLKTNEIGVRDHFFELGGNSLLAMKLFSEIEKEFKNRLPISVIFQEDTIEGLAAQLISGTNITHSSLVPIKPFGTRTPLFCIHGGGGEVLVYGEFASKLGDDQPLYGLRYTESEESINTVEFLAEKYISEIKRIQPEGPYHLFGYCFGGAIAYEMAQKLLKEKEEVALLTILNFANPNRNTIENKYTINYKKIIQNNVKMLFNMPLKKRASFLLLKIKNALKLVEVKQEVESSWSEMDRVRAKLTKAIKSYKPKPFPRTILLIRANEYKDFDKYLGWETFSKGEIIERSMEAKHEELLKNPHVDTVIEFLNECLEKKEFID